MSLLQLLKLENPLIENAIAFQDYTFAIQLIDQQLAQTTTDALTLARIYCLYQSQDYINAHTQLNEWLAQTKDNTDDKATLLAKCLQKGMVVMAHSSEEKETGESFTVEHLNIKFIISTMAINLLLNELVQLPPIENLHVSLFISQLFRRIGQLQSFHSIRASHMVNIAAFLPNTTNWVERILTNEPINEYITPHWTLQQKKALAQLIVAADDYYQALVEEDFYHTAEIFYLTQLSSILSPPKKQRGTMTVDALTFLTSHDRTRLLLHAAKLFSHYNNNQSLAAFLYAYLLTTVLNIKYKIPSLACEINQLSTNSEQLAKIIIEHPTEDLSLSSLVFRIGCGICELILAQLKPKLETLKYLIEKLSALRPDDPTVHHYATQYYELIQTEDAEAKWQELFVRFPEHQEIITGYFTYMLQKYFSPIGNNKAFSYEKLQQIIFDLNTTMQHFSFNRRLIILRALASLTEHAMPKHSLVHQLIEPFQANQELLYKATCLFPYYQRFYYCHSWIQLNIAHLLKDDNYPFDWQQLLEEPLKLAYQHLSRHSLLQKIFTLELNHAKDTLSMLSKVKAAMEYFKGLIYPDFAPDSCRALSHLGIALEIKENEAGFNYRSTGLHHELLLRAATTRFDKKLSLEIGMKIQCEESSPHPFFTCETPLIFLPMNQGIPGRECPTLLVLHPHSEQDACLRMLRPISDLSYVKHMWAFVMRTLYYMSKGFFAPREVVTAIQQYSTRNPDKLEQAHIQAARNYVLFAEQEAKIPSSQAKEQASHRFLVLLRKYQLTSFFLGYTYTPTGDQLHYHFSILNFIRRAHKNWKEAFNKLPSTSSASPHHASIKDVICLQSKQNAFESDLEKRAELLQYATQALILENFTIALQAYDIADSISPLDIDAQLLKIYCIAKNGYANEALSLLNTIETKDIPPLEDEVLKLNMTLTKNDYLLFLRLYPLKKIGFLRAYCLLQIGKMVDAASTILRYEQHINLCPEMQLMMADCYRKSGHFEGMSTIIAELLKSICENLFPTSIWETINASKNASMPQPYLEALSSLPEIYAHGKKLPRELFQNVFVSYLTVLNWYSQVLIEDGYIAVACNFYEKIISDDVTWLFELCPELLFHFRLLALRAFSKNHNAYADQLDQVSNQLSAKLLSFSKSRTIDFNELTEWLINTPPEIFDPEMLLHANAILQAIAHIQAYDIGDSECSEKLFDQLTRYKHHLNELTPMSENLEKIGVTESSSREYYFLLWKFKHLPNDSAAMKSFYSQILSQRECFPFDKNYMLLEFAYYLRELKNTPPDQLNKDAITQHPAALLANAMAALYPHDVNVLHAIYTLNACVKQKNCTGAIITNYHCADINTYYFFMKTQNGREHQATSTILPSVLNLLAHFSQERSSLFNYNTLITPVCLKNLPAMQIMEKFNDTFLIAPGVLLDHFTGVDIGDDLFQRSHCHQISVVANPQNQDIHYTSPLFSFQALYLMQTPEGCVAIDPTGYAKVDYQNRVLRLIGKIKPTFLVTLPTYLLEILFYLSQGFTPVGDLAEALKTAQIKDTLPQKEQIKIAQMMQFHLDFLAKKPDALKRYWKLLDEYGMTQNITAKEMQNNDATLKSNFTNPYLNFISYESLLPDMRKQPKNMMLLDHFADKMNALCDNQQQTLLALEEDCDKKTTQKKTKKHKNKTARSNKITTIPVHESIQKTISPPRKKPDTPKIKIPDEIQFYFNQFNNALIIGQFPGKFWLVGSASLCLAKELPLSKTQDLDFVLQLTDPMNPETIKSFLLLLGFVPTLKQSVFIREDELAHVEIYISPFVEANENIFLTRDMSTRDFTLGAIYCDGTQFLNPAWGLDDYDLRKLTAIARLDSTPAQTAKNLLLEDPRRILRAFKLMIRYQLTLDVHLENALKTIQWTFHPKNPKHILMQSLLMKAFTGHIVRMSRPHRSQYLDLINQYHLTQKLPCLKLIVDQWTMEHRASTKGMNRFAPAFYPSPPVFWDNRQTSDEEIKTPLPTANLVRK
ncbi:MAG: hypothetical protein SFW66_09740 [Gammaproteobacteria bacterium]|nr:hypothetical protein [Gammaproteobacteria bacterium]